MAELCVAHLVRKKNGLEPFARFINSYRNHPAGMEHDLLLIFKGFAETDGLDDYYALLGDVAHRQFFVEDEGYDIGPYFQTATKFEYRYFCFLNSYSVLLAKDWLAKMYSHITRGDVGIVGATGSYESALTFYLNTNRRSVSKRRPVKRLLEECRRFIRAARLNRNFAPFPNPHVRTNAFLCARQTLVQLRIKTPRTKSDAEMFESGKEGLTGQILAMKLQALVVGRDGLAYPMTEWFESSTFRSGGQRNLLVADNRTEQYANADPETQSILASYAWGKITNRA